jgi:hypothetical protein
VVIPDQKDQRKHRRQGGMVGKEGLEPSKS